MGLAKRQLRNLFLCLFVISEEKVYKTANIYVKKLTK